MNEFNEEPIKDQSFVSSWSGGKDSCLALYHVLQSGGCVKHLFCMLTEEGKRSRSHGLSREVLEKQAEVLNIPLTFSTAPWNTYEAVFTQRLSTLREAGVGSVVFGDIDILEHRQWCRDVCAAADMQAVHPLWQRARRELLTEFIRLGFKATIIAIRDKVLAEQYLGEELTTDLIYQLEQTGIDPSGERGEYHTVVVDGPIFSSAMSLIKKDRVLRDGYWFLDVSVN